MAQAHIIPAPVLIHESALQPACGQAQDFARANALNLANSLRRWAPSPHSFTDEDTEAQLVWAAPGHKSLDGQASFGLWSHVTKVRTHGSSIPGPSCGAHSALSLAGPASHFLRPPLCAPPLTSPHPQLLLSLVEL